MNDNGRSNNEYTNNDNEVQFFNIDEESAQNDVMNLSVDLSSLDSHAAHVEEHPYNRNNNDINTPANEVLHQQIRHNFPNKEEEYQAIQAVERAQRDSQLPSTSNLNKDDATLKTVTINNNRLAEQFKDPKRYCKFCKKHFSHQGSYGRHLDLKKGDELHPMEEIAKIRSKVVRRNGFLDNERLEARKSKKKVASRIYNKRENVKEKNKIRRKLRDREIKARLMTNEWYLNQLGSGSAKLGTYTFAKLVCLYIPVKSWPLGSPPGEEIFENLIAVSANHSNTLLEEVKDSYSVWHGYSFEKRRDLWFSEQKQALEETLGNFTLIELQQRNQIMDKQKKDTFDNLCKQDNLMPSTTQGYQENVNFIDSNESEDDDTNQTITNSSFQRDGTNYFENH